MAAAVRILLHPEMRTCLDSCNKCKSFKAWKEILCLHLHHNSKVTTVQCHIPYN